MEKTTLVDLHTHLADDYSPRFAEKIPVLGGRQFKGIYPSLTSTFETRESLVGRLLDRCFSVADRAGANVLVGIVNFDDARAEEAFQDITQACRMQGLSYCGGVNSVLSITSPKVRGQVNYIRGQEIPTIRGHVLTIGSDKRIKARELSEALDEARQGNALVFGDHTLDSYDFVQRVYGFLGKSFCLQEADIIKYAKRFDGLFFGGDKQTKLSRELNIPLYASSDSHRVEDIFSSYTCFEDLPLGYADLDSSELKQAIRQKLKQSLRETADEQSKRLRIQKPNNFEGVRHAVSCVLIGSIGIPSGLIVK